MELADYLARRQPLVEEALDRLLPPETTRPAVLHRAMRYSVMAGGKRLRPILCLAAAEACGGRPEDALIPAAALECLHTYTLIHDDLPAMDNDDLRRGKPTCHKVFGEANAILAGDALLTFAFELLATAPREPARLALELARATGSRGVIAGQVEDMAAEGQPPEAGRVEFIHQHKTGDLIVAACRMGAIAAGAPEAALQALTRYAEATGLAFQIADDLLNATATPAQLGKAAGSDAARGKMTYVAVHGMDTAREKAADLIRQATAQLRVLPGPTEALALLAAYCTQRAH